MNYFFRLGLYLLIPAGEEGKQGIVLIALTWVDFSILVKALLHRCDCTGNVLCSGLCVYSDFNGFSSDTSWLRYSWTEGCLSSVWEKPSVFSGPTALGGLHMQFGGGWRCVNANALEGRSMGSSLTTVGWWLSLLGHPHNTLSLYWLH